MSSFQIETQEQDVTLRLHGDVTIEHARELHTALLGALEGGRALRIDASDVTRIDAAILQVLTAAGGAGGAELTAGSAAWETALGRFAFNPLAPAAGSSSTP